MALTSGTRLGPYEIVGQLGEGGMGQVYSARDTRLDRTVAIKDIWALPLTGEHTPTKVIATQFTETLPAFSPDGRFIAYRSNESGRPEIYVQTFPDPGGKWQVSVAGATDPQWRADSRELYFRATDQRLMAVDVQGSAGTFQAGAPRALFSMRTQAGSGLRNRYSASKTGDRFVTVAPQSREAIGPTTVVLHWDGALQH